ncbi:MAG: peptidylprolyl isomerase [Coriobacteriia bacterium]|nr:peptidylprolyl isomerase [Coriobacteriia bacterium]
MHVSEIELTGSETAVITTSKGIIRMAFFPDVAPNTVASFVELTRDGFYDGIKFHRVEPNFVVQGGDPLTKALSSEEVREITGRQKARVHSPSDPALGSGGPGFTITAEFNDRPHLEGTLAMARSQQADSAGSQFYICLGPQPFLDGQYTVFGEVTDGVDVVHAIEVGDTIESVVIEERQ